MQTITFNYLYRDSSNYKNFGSIDFSNPDNISIEEIETAIQSNLIDREFFVAENWELPTLYFDELTEGDHNWHEFVSLEVKESTEDLLLISDFLVRIITNIKTGP